MRNKKISIVCSEFYSDLLDNLFIGVDKALDEFNSKKNTNISYSSDCVPGAFEIPVTVKLLIDKKQYNVIITLGVIIRGETPHFEYIANECVHGISQLAIKTGVPIILGVLTVNNRKQAMNRSENTGKNKGSEAAQAALDMVDVLENR